MRYNDLLCKNTYKRIIDTKLEFHLIQFRQKVINFSLKSVCFRLFSFKKHHIGNSKNRRKKQTVKTSRHQIVKKWKHQIVSSFVSLYDCICFYSISHQNLKSKTVSSIMSFFPAVIFIPFKSISAEGIQFFLESVCFRFSPSKSIISGICQIAEKANR